MGLDAPAFLLEYGIEDPARGIHGDEEYLYVVELPGQRGVPSPPTDDWYVRIAHIDRTNRPDATTAFDTVRWEFDGPLGEAADLLGSDERRWGALVVGAHSATPALLAWPSPRSPVRFTRTCLMLARCWAGSGVASHVEVIDVLEVRIGREERCASLTRGPGDGVIGDVDLLSLFPTLGFDQRRFYYCGT